MTVELVHILFFYSPICSVVVANCGQDIDSLRFAEMPKLSRCLLDTSSESESEISDQ